MFRFSLNKLFIWVLPLAFALIISLPIFSQAEDFAKAIDFFPPPPNASAIIKSSLLSVGKNTGSPNVSIPLASVRGYALSTGVSLNYNSTGIKVDEIASRVGMGWSLQAGGVVTRTVRGAVDERTARAIPPTSFSNDCQSYFFLKNVNDCNEGNRFDADAEPDLFNFSMNGITGAFVINSEGQPVLISAEKLKIVPDFSHNASWNFRITDTEGITYYFGGAGAIEKTKRESSCGRSYDTPIPTSWYLSKIEHTNGEAIILSYMPLNYIYETGVSESMNWISPIIDFNVFDPHNSTNTACPVCPSGTGPKICVNRVSTEGVLLTRIKSVETNSWADFAYISRFDCSDKLVSEVSYYTNEGLFGKYTFEYVHQGANMMYANQVAPGYDKAPYLVGLKEFSSENAAVGEHRFHYNDLAARPPRLSFSQDHWGYFNGVRNYSTMIPFPVDLSLIQKFPFALANREAAEGFAAKGLLNKIIYPGGGIDSVVYEPNVTFKGSSAPYHVLNLQITGTGFKNPVSTTATFTVSFRQNVELQLFCQASGPVDDPMHQTGLVQLNSSGGLIHSQQINAGYTGNVLFQLDPGTYTLYVQANGSVINTKTAAKYRPLPPGSQESKIVGGCRVKYLIKGSPGHKSLIKRYYYGEIATPEISSLVEMPDKLYHKNTLTSLACETMISNSPGTPAMAFCRGISMASNSLSNIFDYAGSPISYSSVIESDGDDFSNGCLHNKFFTKADQAGVLLWGEDIKGCPLSNFSAFLNGKPQVESVYKKNAAGTLVLLKQTRSTYSYDAQDQQVVSGITVEKRFTPTIGGPLQPCDPTAPVLPQLVGAYNAVRYDVMSFWVHLDSTIETTYDQDGLNPRVIQTTFNYGNANHHNVTQTSLKNSKDENIVTQFKYPHDFSSVPVYATLIAKNMINKVVETNTFNNLLKTSRTIVNYEDWGNGNFSMRSFQKSLADGILEVEGSIDLVDSRGRVLQFTEKDGVTRSVIWGGDKNRFPVAKVSGGGYSQAISHLTVSPEALESLDEASLTSQVNKIRAGLPNAQVETYTYRVKTGISSKVDINNKLISFIYDSNDRLSLIKDFNGDIIKRFDYFLDPSTASSLTLYFNTRQSKNFNCQLCLPGYSGNQVSYAIPENTYFSTVSELDANQKATIALNTLGQSYANNYGTCSKGAFVFYNDPQSGTFLTECGTGFSGSFVPYSIPAGAYTGPTQYDANALAQWHLAVDGQAYANSYGTCTPTCTSSTCSGEDKKCIDGMCQTGVKIYTSSVQVHGSLWQCTYHYEWSDGSWSQNYNESKSTPCLNEV